MRRLGLGLFLLLGGCINSMSGMRDGLQQERDLAFDEMRLEIGDLRHAIQGQRTEITLLQDRLRDQEGMTDTALKTRSRLEPLVQQLASLEKKFLLLERQQDRILSDLKMLGKHHDQSGTSLQAMQEKLRVLQLEIEQHAARLNDIVQLKSTLNQVSRAISDKNAPAQAKRYRVKSGDSLEKIAKQHGISVSELKKLNNLNTDKILAGQELLIDSP